MREDSGMVKMFRLRRGKRDYKSRRKCKCEVIRQVETHKMFASRRNRQLWTEEGDVLEGIGDVSKVDRDVWNEGWRNWKADRCLSWTF